MVCDWYWQNHYILSLFGVWLIAEALHHLASCPLKLKKYEKIIKKKKKLNTYEGLSCCLHQIVVGMEPIN